MTSLAPTLQAFFTDRLIGQRQASPHTIAAYRDTFRLLLRYAAEQTGSQPSALDLGDLDAPLVAGFLDHLEHDRGNTERTRNHRLAAIHSLFAYAALHHPEHAASIQRVLAVPPKRFERNLVTYLTDDEVDALLAAPDPDTWTGRRDHAMWVLTIQTGLRISELTGLTCADVVLGVGAHVHCIGKGRKERRTPLLAPTVDVLDAWVTERAGALGDQPAEQRHHAAAAAEHVAVAHAREHGLVEAAVGVAVDAELLGDELRDGLQRRFELGRVVAARLCEVRPAAAAGTRAPPERRTRAAAARS